MPPCGALWIGWASHEKKTPRASEQERPEVQQAREVFQGLIEQVDPKRLFYFDEFSLNLSMTRSYALAPSGERAYGSIPVNPGVTVTLVLGLGLKGVVEPCAIQGSMNGHVFGAYISQSVLPHLPSNAIIVVDNTGAHHADEVYDALESCGVRVIDSFEEANTRHQAPGVQMWFLPPYSPELTPVEECGSKIKALTRSANPRTAERLIDAMGRAIGDVTPQDAQGWFDHARRARAPKPRSQERKSPRLRDPRSHAGSMDEVV